MDELQERKEALLKQQKEGDALRELQNHQGWKELVGILEELYKDSVAHLIADESPYHRQRIKVLEEISDRIRASIDYAKVAKEELKSERFHLTQPTP